MPRCDMHADDCITLMEVARVALDAELNERQLRLGDAMDLSEDELRRLSDALEERLND